MDEGFHMRVPKNRLRPHHLLGRKLGRKVLGVNLVGGHHMAVNVEAHGGLGVTGSVCKLTGGDSRRMPEGDAAVTEVVRMLLGDITTLREDSTGGYFETSLFEGIPPLLMSGLRAGVYGMSFQFSVVKEDYRSRPGKSAFNPTGLPERTLKEVRLFEISCVTFPAYDGTSAVVGKPRSRRSDWRLT
jgi:hypothetical protein